MNSVIAPALADSTTYNYMGSAGQRLQRVKLARAFQFPSVQICLFGEISNELIVTQPIQINIEMEEDESYVVSDDIFFVYGYGEDRPEALKDYVSSLFEFYTLVEKGAANNQFDKKLFAHLQTFMKTKSQRGYNAIQADRD